MSLTELREQTLPFSATKKSVLRCLFQLLLLSYLEIAVRGTNVRLQPTDLTVDIGTLATFNCTISCELRDTHTVRWFVGHSPNSRRLVDSNFHERTGIQVELRELIGCDATSTIAAKQQLSVNVTSVERLNRTAIQCAALRKGPTHSDLYSHYGVLLVNDEMEEPTPTSENSASSTTTTPTSENLASSSTTIQPSHTGIPASMGNTKLLGIEPSHCPTVAVTVSVSETYLVTVTRTVIVTHTPEPGVIMENKVSHASLGSSKGISASFLLTLFLVSLSLIIKLR